MISKKEKLIYVGKSDSQIKTEKVLTNVVNTIIIGIVMILLYLPIVIITLQSFNDSRNLSVFNGFTFRWYKELFSPANTAGEHFQDAVINSLCVTILATVFSTIIGTVFALGINSLSKKGRQRMIMINNVPIVNADIVTGITLMILFSMFMPMLNIWTVLIAHIFFCTPYIILSVLPKLSSIDKNLYDAGIDLGCTPWTSITKVIIPSIMPGIMMGALLAFTMSIDDFTISYYTGASLEGYYNVSTYIYLTSGKKTQSSSMYAYNTLITFGTLAVLVVYNLITSLKHNSASKGGIKK